MSARRHRWHATWPRCSIAPAIAALALLAAGCSGSTEDRHRTVTGYEFANCDSVPTTDPLELEALNRFREHAIRYWFHDAGDSLYAAMHERTGRDSGLRQYRGERYWYLHVLKVTPKDTARQVEWKALAYLHQREVRSRVNGEDWTDWQRVRTRNFDTSGAAPSPGSLGRWACLIGAEIAWAEVSRIATPDGLVWRIKPLGAGPYPEEEVHRLDPLPTPEQIANEASVPAGSLAPTAPAR